MPYLIRNEFGNIEIASEKPKNGDFIEVDEELIPGFMYEVTDSGEVCQYPMISVDMHSSTTKRISELESENAILKAQLQAQTDRSDFIEDCIAEMAMQVYAE